jgi:hypothetical protein
MSRSRPVDPSSRSDSAIAFHVIKAPHDGITHVEATAATGKTWNIFGV